jgi:preprotein translocase SecE subunit
VPGDPGAGAVEPIVPVEPITPVEPIDPIDPVDPIDPIVPVDSVDPVTIEEVDLAAGAPLQDLGTPHALPPDDDDDDAFEDEPLVAAGSGPSRSTADALEAEDELLPAARKTRGGPPAKVGGNRVTAFLRASWAELQRVQWPDRRQVGQATAVVLGFVVIAGGYLGLVDLLSSKIVDAIL